MDIQNENLIQSALPHNKEAEQSVLGAMLLNQECVTTAFESLEESDFYIEANKKIYAAMASLFNRNVPVDLVTVSDELSSMSALEAVGGIQYLSYLASTLPTTANIEQHIEIILGNSARRKYSNIGQQLKDKSLDLGVSPAEIADFAGKLIFDATDSKARDIRHIRDVLIDTHENLTSIYNSKGKLTGVPTGFSSLDSYLNGLQKSDLIILAARPSVGKTSFALNIAANAAIKGNVPVAIFSLEMSGTQLVSRIMSSEMLIDSGHLRSGELEDDDWEKIAVALNTLGKAPIYISENPSVKVADIRATCRRLKSEKGLGLIVIDYLQLMQGNRSESRQNEVSDMSRSLKLLAKELNVPILTLSQLSRASEQRKDDNQPKLSDLRESGAIEQDADIVLFLYRDASTEEEVKQIKLSIAKHRAGSLGTIDLVWKGEYTRFFDRDDHH